MTSQERMKGVIRSLVRMLPSSGLSYEEGVMALEITKEVIAKIGEGLDSPEEVEAFLDQVTGKKDKN